MVGSAPCQPFTGFTNKSDRVDCRNHKGYDALFGEVGSVLSLVGKVLPHWFLSEQVINFSKPYSGTNSSYSPKDKYMEDMKAITNSKHQPHFTGHVAVKLDSDKFVEGSRPRWPCDLHCVK